MRPREEHRRPAIDRDALRKALEGSLHKKTSVAAPETATAPSPSAMDKSMPSPAKDQVKTPNKKTPEATPPESKGSSMKPGEVIRF